MKQFLEGLDAGLATAVHLDIRMARYGGDQKCIGFLLQACACFSTRCAFGMEQATEPSRSQIGDTKKSYLDL
jgi:hypothetical protein